MDQKLIDFFARPGQFLRSHLKGVADRCRSLAKEIWPFDLKLQDAAALVGLLHDLGKYRQEFQAYLKAGKQAKKTPETAHSVYGAAALYETSLALAYAIAGHHSGLHDRVKLAELIEGKKFYALQRYTKLLDCAKQPEELGLIPMEVDLGIDEENTKEPAKRSYDLLTRMLFSLLIDSDRLDSEKHQQEQKFGKGWERFVAYFHADCLLDRLHAARNERAAAHPEDELNRLRSQVFDQCLRRGLELSQGFFSLTVPTGGGKTLSSMAFALVHAKRHALRRVIVVIPFLSIIEQNAREYRDIFGAGQVLEHHSAVEPPEKARPSDPGGDDEPPEASDMERAMENWDAPIIVTTSVQFLETLFACTTRRARKLHNVARSVVIFDEVQTLPVHLLNPTLDMLRELKEGYNVSFLFCSATQPAFRKSANLNRGFTENEMPEIAPDPSKLYSRLKRVEYRVEPVENKWNWRRLAEGMVQRQQVLTVLNLRRQAFDAWQTVQELLKEKGQEDNAKNAVFHLSSAMCPAHRLDILGLSKSPLANNIKKRLKKGRPCWVISTQLIEAGVDIDFPVVFRAMGPLDSIVQSAGRCNREGLLQENGQPKFGDVIVFHPEDSGQPGGIYETATGITPNFLTDTKRLTSDPDLFAQYFTELYHLSPTDHSRKGEDTIQKERADFNFRTVAERARVIRDQTISVIVRYGRANELIQAVRSAKRFDRDSLRRLQRFMVNLRHQGPNSDFMKLQGFFEPLTDRLEIPVLSKECYDPQRGVIVATHAPEDLIV